MLCPPWNARFGICLAFLSVYDAVVAYGTRGRWFNVHAMANAVSASEKPALGIQKNPSPHNNSSEHVTPPLPVQRPRR